jgi:hypothetical protein
VYSSSLPIASSDLNMISPSASSSGGHLNASATERRGWNHVTGLTILNLRNDLTVSAMEVLNLFQI